MDTLLSDLQAQIDSVNVKLQEFYSSFLAIKTDVDDLPAFRDHVDRALADQSEAQKSNHRL